MSITKVRISFLDTMRAFSVVAVLIYHYTFRYSEIFALPNSDWMIIFQSGHIGVNIFFMLSGYLIYGRVSALAPAEIKKFLIIRAFRLYPAFWVCALITFTFMLYFPAADREVSFSTFLVNLTMIPRLLGAEFVDGAYWSLEVEIIFYLLISAIAAFLKPRGRIIALGIWSFVAVSIDIFAPKGAIFSMIKIATISTWLPYFAMGIVTNLLHKKTIKLTPYLLCVSFLMVPTIHRYIAAEPASIVVVFLAVAFMAGRGIDKLATPLGAWLAGISYPLYLIHQNIGYSIIQALTHHKVPLLIAISITAGLMMIIAQIIHSLIEDPAHRYAVRRFADARKAA